LINAVLRRWLASERASLAKIAPLTVTRRAVLAAVVVRQTQASCGRGTDDQRRVHDRTATQQRAARFKMLLIAKPIQKLDRRTHSLAAALQITNLS
jgi:hypothetical protein